MNRLEQLARTPSTIGTRRSLLLLGLAVTAVLIVIALVPYVAQGTGTGPSFSFPAAIAVEASGDLVVVDADLAAVLRIDPVTGDRAIVSDAGTGAGPSFSSPEGIAIEASGDLVVVDLGLDAMLRIDAVTGDRTVVSNAGTGTGPSFSSPRGIVVETSGDLIVVDNFPAAVLRVDPVTGDRTIVSNSGTGAGPSFSTLRGIAVEASGDLVVTDFGLDVILRVDPVTGDRTILSDAGTCASPGFLSPRGIAVEASGDLVVADVDLDAVLRVDPVTGDLTIVSDPTTGTGPSWVLPGSIAIEASGDLVVLDTQFDAVYRVEPVTGDRVSLSASSKPPTPSPTPIKPPDALLDVKKLIASDADGGDKFGVSVSVSGDTAIVGANLDEHPGGFNAGAAYIFRGDEGGAGNWGEVKKLCASDTQGGDAFGGSVTVSADTAVVGAASEDAGGNGAGAAYVFERDQGGTSNWGEVVKLVASDAEESDSFGVSVSVSGNTAFVGAHLEDAEGNAAGAAYVFERDQGGVDNWGEVKKLTASDAQQIDTFGRSVAISGDTAVVGARFEDAGGGISDNFGAAYIFERDEGGADNWGEVQKLIASDAEELDEFGFMVAISGDTVLVGTYLEDTEANDAGAAYVFQRDQGGADNWGEVKKLTASDAEAGDFFGQSVAVSGDAVVVGAGGEDTVASDAGAAYVFRRDEGGADNWGELKKLSAFDAQMNGGFGISAAAAGDIAVVGAWRKDAGANVAGAAYVFDTVSPGDTDQDGCTDEAENGPNEYLGGQRDHLYFWDYFDVWSHPFGQPTVWVRDKVINVPGDIIGVASRFGPGTAQNKEDALAAALTPPVSDSGYHAGFDRGPVIGANNWNRAPADGAINIPDDIIGVAFQFGHSCT